MNLLVHNTYCLSHHASCIMHHALCIMHHASCIPCGVSFSIGKEISYNSSKTEMVRCIPFSFSKGVFFVDIGAPGWPLGNNLYLNWPQLATLQTYPIIEYIYMWHPEKNLKAGKLQKSPFQNILFWEIGFFKLFFPLFFIFRPKKLFFPNPKKIIYKI